MQIFYILEICMYTCYQLTKICGVSSARDDIFPRAIMTLLNIQKIGMMMKPKRLHMIESEEHNNLALSAKVFYLISHHTSAKGI